MYNNLLTYNRMPLSSISEIDDCVGKDYMGNFLIRYDASQWLDVNKLVNCIKNIDTNYLSTIDTKLINHGIEVNNEIEKLKEENYQLQQRLDKLEMLLGDN